MTRILVIPDTHQKHVKVQKLIDSVEFDRCIFLGDFFDDFGDTAVNTKDTALWLREKIFPDPRFVILYGNHDFAYYFAYNPATRCSGYTDAKRAAIFSVLSYDEIIARVKFFHVEAGYLFSHAGVTNQVWKDIQRMEPEGATLLDVLPKWVKRSFDGARTLSAMPMFECGWSRGGRSQYGGMIWADWDEFNPISGVNQIVGHTPHDVPEVIVKFSDGNVRYYNANEWVYNKTSVLAKQVTSINYALDTHLNHFAIITDGDVELWDWNTMLPMKEGMIITSETGSSFVPDRQLHQPDFGVFRVTNPAGQSEIITGKELCDFEQYFSSSPSNVIMVLARKLKAGYKVAFIRRKKKIKGQPDPEQLPAVHDERETELMKWLSEEVEKSDNDQPTQP